MRRKAEQRIRAAAADIGGNGPYRLDEVRAGAGLHPKIFDKTIIDMERVGTITLEPLAADSADAAAAAGFVRSGDRIYARFRFVEGPSAAPAPPWAHEAARNAAPAPIDATVVILQHLLPGEWEAFSDRCQTREGMSPHEKIEEMIRRYLYADS